MLTVTVNGLFLGLVYGLLGVGLVVVYRGSRVINFAYGETGMIGAFLFASWAQAGAPAWLAVIGGVAVSALIGGATELLIVRPLRGQSRLTVMVATFAAASLMLVFATRRWGLNPQYVEPLAAGSPVEIAGLAVRGSQLLVLGVTALVLAGLWALYRFTSFGLRLRATALDPYAAGLVGVDVQRTSMATWALAGGLAGLSAILVAPLVAFHVFFMTALMIRGIAAALVGGLTSIWGAVVAGLLLGVGESVISFTTPVAGIVELTIAGFIILLLLLRPSGLVRSVY